jgi:diguanylate cyclase (GGDEF)-like protein
MARVGRVVLFAAFVAVMAAAAWLQYTSQRTRSDRASDAATAVGAVYDRVVEAENAARDYTVTRDPTALQRFTDSRAQLTKAADDARAAITDTSLRTRLDAEVTLVDAWATSVDADVTAVTGGTTSESGAASAAARGQQLAQIHTAADELVHALDQHDRDQRNADALRGVAIVIAACVLFTVLNWLLFLRTERRAAQTRDRQLAFAERLQTARSEDAARGMLARHLESLAPDTMALVTEPDDPSPAGRPVVSGGERVATVILRSPRDLTPATERLVHDSILRAAPVLATLRSLTVAQARAATDPLTGLGNRRLVEDALARLAAQSRRTGGSYAVAVIDLDRFKPVNDRYGHAAGDALLIAVASALDAATREYDVVGRQGGDEFIVLLADVDSTMAATVMDRCRQSVAGLRVGDPPLSVTASIGVAVSGTGDAADAAALARAADDAVYEAKARGGNCVVTTVATVTSTS